MPNIQNLQVGDKVKLVNEEEARENYDSVVYLSNLKGIYTIETISSSSARLVEGNSFYYRYLKKVPPIKHKNGL